jgi:hypothetical protein
MYKQRKYRNTPTVYDGIKFDSKKEGLRYLQLKLLLRAGVISELVLQPVFPIIINDIKVCKYQADFSYMENGKRVVEDVKSQGTKTRLYSVKRKLMRAVHGVEIKET